MDSDLLKTFLEVRRSRGVHAAAENLYVTPAAVSARILRLEQLLGVTLFKRTTRGMDTTPAGERLQTHAETVLAAWARASQSVGLPDDKAGRLHFGSTPGLWSFGFGDRVAALAQDMPDLVLQLESHPPTELVRRLELGLLDVILLFDPLPRTGYKLVQAGNIELVCVASGGEADGPQGAHYVYVEWGLSFDAFHAQTFGLDVTPILRVDLADVAVRYLRQVPGSAYLPASAADEFQPVDQCPGFSRPVFAAWPEDVDHAAAMTDILRVLFGSAMDQ